MNEFLDKHGYRLYQGTNLVLIRHYNTTLGCVHAIFISLIVALLALSVFLYVFTGHVTMMIITLLAALVYIIEYDRRKKQVPRMIIDFGRKIFKVLKGKHADEYNFSDVMQVVTTSEHLGGFASSDRSSTEEYKREINLMFNNGFILTAFSIISDEENAEPEVTSLISWLERVIKR